MRAQHAVILNLQRSSATTTSSEQGAQSPSAAVSDAPLYRVLNRAMVRHDFKGKGRVLGSLKAGELLAGLHLLSSQSTATCIITGKLGFSAIWCITRT